jgi:thioredoxin reductase (NADPH)
MAPAPITTDVLIVGAGPVGLFQVFELGLLELQAHVVDALPQAGGQCIELYPDKPIYDIPGLAEVSGRELTQRLLRQCAPFKPGLHLDQLVTQVRPREDGRFDVETSAGTRFDAGALVLAAGVGAFLPRELRLTGIEHLAPGQLHERRLPTPLPDDLDGQHVIVLGDEDDALIQACDLADDGRCARVTLLHRRDQFRASDALQARLAAARGAGRLHFVAAQPLALHTTDDGRTLQALQVIDADDQEARLEAQRLIPLLGLSPRLGPLADWGLALQRKLLPVDTARYETAHPGIHAVGDINTYPGKRKLLLCGFHEATLAAFAIAERLRPDQRILLQYTTTSPRLHELLGVRPQDTADKA